MLQPHAKTLLAAAVLLGLSFNASSHPDEDGNKETKDLAEIKVHADSNNAVGTVGEQRAAVAVTTVMTKQQIDAVPAASIVDVVSHMPGVSAYSDMHFGQAATGSNQYVTIRGLDASYNAYTLNGFALPETDSSTRAISLNMLAPFGIQSVKVSKAPTPDMPGDSIGGTIDMRTPTAFDFDGDHYSKTTMQGSSSALASDLGVPDKGGTVQQEVARRFGPDQSYGVYVAAYLGNTHNAAQTIAPNDYYKPVDPSQASATDLRDVGDLRTAQYKYSIYTSLIKRYGANISLDWRGENTTLYARAIYGRYDVKGEQNQASARNQNSSQYVRGQYFNTHDSNETTAALQFGGSSQLDRLQLDYGTSFGYGTRNRPDYVAASLYGPLQSGQFLFDLSNPRFASLQPNSPAQRAYFYNLASDALWKVQGSDAGSRDNRVNAHIDGKFRFDEGVLESVSFGVLADTSKRNAYDHPFFHGNGNFVYDGVYFGGTNHPYNEPAGPSLAALPGQIIYGTYGGKFEGPFKLIDRSYLLAQAVPYKYVNDPGGAGNYTENDYNANTTSSRENIYAGYFMANLQAGKLSVVPGVRYEFTDYSASSWQSDGNRTSGAFVNTGRNYGELLPGISVNYRPNEMTVYRASLRRSFSRPAFGLISGETSYSIDDISGEVVGISAPNPDLNPTTANNLDFSAEFYDTHGGLVTLSTYYKRINGFIYTSQSTTSNDNTLGGNVPTGTVVSGGIPITMPQNGGAAKLYGAEFAVRKQLLDLPGVWSHFGVGANATLQHSQAESKRADRVGETSWLPRAPEHMYNLDLFYDDARLHADLTYNYTGLQLLGLTTNHLDYYLQPVKTLDLNARYTVGEGFELGVSAKNLLNEATFYETQGKSTKYLAYDPGADGAYVQTGRVYMLTLSKTF